MGLYPHAIHRLIHRMWIKSATIHMVIPRMWITHDFVDNLIHRVASYGFLPTAKMQWSADLTSSAVVFAVPATVFAVFVTFLLDS